MSANSHNEYKNVRAASMRMVEQLEKEDFIPQPIAYVSPPKWNLAHTSWFFEEFILKSFSPSYKVFHSQYAFLFNSYYNTVGDRVVRHKRGDLSRPTVDEILEYRAYVDKNMEDLLSVNKLDQKLIELLALGLNHEQQHQELFFTDLKYSFGVNPLYPVYINKAYCEDRNEEAQGLISITEGLYEIGFKGDGFSYDNELSEHKVFLNSFEISKTLVTNGEYLDFIEMEPILISRSGTMRL